MTTVRMALPLALIAVSARSQSGIFGGPTDVLTQAKSLQAEKRTTDALAAVMKGEIAVQADAPDSVQASRVVGLSRIPVAGSMQEGTCALLRRRLAP